MSNRQTIVLWLALLLLFPFAVIWAFNTLFSLGIPVTPKTYFAAIVIEMLVGFIKATDKK